MFCHKKVFRCTKFCRKSKLVDEKEILTTTFFMHRKEIMFRYKKE